MTPEQVACIIVLVCVFIPLLLIAWDEHQNDALGDKDPKLVRRRVGEPPPDGGRLVAIKCTACGEEFPCSTQGQIPFITEQHRARCPKWRPPES